MLRGKKVLVTGGAGFLGSHLCERLLTEGAAVSIIDTFASGKENNILSIKDRIKVIKGELADDGLMDKASAGTQIIIHTAFPLEIREGNYSSQNLNQAARGFFNVLNACLNENALLVKISSIAVYGNPQYTPVNEKHPLEPETLYGAFKIAEETYCTAMAKCRGLQSVILRVADIYGPKNTRLSVPISFLLKAISNKPLMVFGSGWQGRTYTYVDDFVDAVMLAIAAEKARGEIFNIAGSQIISLLELAETVKNVTGGGVKVVLDPETAADDRRLAIDIEKAKRILQFHPKVDIAEGLRKTANWIRENPDYYINK